MSFWNKYDGHLAALTYFRMPTIPLPINPRESRHLKPKPAVQKKLSSCDTYRDICSYQIQLHTFHHHGRLTVQIQILLS
jgi:hypothetical protein